MEKYETSIGVTKTFEAKSEENAIQLFVEWIRGEGRKHIHVIKKER